uniref:Uncharacterized protein n=1 Tax=Solanum lycopersicum TaxID=4081 RepID=A0A3Q7IBL0_SOLLC
MVIPIERRFFKKFVPVITYEDIQPDINRIANGDTSPILCSQPVSEFILREVVYVGSLFTSAFIRAMRFLEDHWSQLCKDIRTGTITNKVTDPSVRETRLGVGLISSRLNAATIHGKGFQVKYLTHSFRPWPISSSCQFTGAMNSSILSPFPTLLNVKDEQQLVDLIDVKTGQEYELVVTTYSGLYRYRVGYVLRVAGYKNNAPQFNFIRRENVILTIDFDKTNEFDLQNAVDNAEINLMPFDARVVDYTSYADTATIPGHSVLFLELNVNVSAPIPPSVIEDCCLTIEESLDKSIGPLEIRIVETGTFDKLMDYCCTSLLGASINQYKTPRCVAPFVELLNSRVVSSYFSPVCPKWVPGSKQWNDTN